MPKETVIVPLKQKIIEALKENHGNTNNDLTA